ncbi:MAG: thioredoxin family protein [Fluviicola sp.]|nr:thioredoxin family protein [Fluviicola sp.]
MEQDYEYAKHVAAEQHKLLIVDFYTTWCTPCKVLDKKIFKNDSIASQISERFVVLKYDAEQDTVYNLSLKHHVCSYPTTVVLTADGKLIRKMYGFGRSEPLEASYINLLQESISLHEQGKYITGFSPTIDPDKYPDFYKKYIRRIANISPNDLTDYWMHNQDLKSEVSFAILAYFGRAPQNIVDLLIQHRSEYETRYGEADVKFVINNVVAERFNTAIKEKDEIKYEAAVKFAKQYLTSRDADEYVKAYEVKMCMATGKWEKATSILEERVRQNTINGDEINYFCWAIYEQCSQKNVIGRATQLMKGVVEVNSSFATLDTYARLLAKNGSREEAVVAMKRAIKMGNENGEDTKDSEEALGKF